LKLLHLFRHAKSSWDEAGLEDHDRGLAPRGRDGARAMGRFMASAGIRPDLVLVSTARRARATFELAERDWKLKPEHQVARELYLASGAELARRIRGLDDRLGSVMLIGHNPGMHELALALVGSGGEEDRRRLAKKYPTAALVSIEFEVERWRQIKPGEGRLARFVTPKELGAIKDP
jgi:phosphohistidine phosphatase